MTAPAPNVSMSVPIPTGPPSSQPAMRTTAHRSISTMPIGIFGIRFPRPTRSESLGPQHRAAPIYPHAKSHENKTNKHRNDSYPDILIQRYWVDIIIELDEVPCEQSINDSTVTNTLMKQKVDDENHNGHYRHSCPIAKVSMVSYSHAETVPRGEANVSKDCQMNTLESKDRQPCRNLEPLQHYDILSKPGVFVEDVDANIVIEFIEELEDKTGLKSKTIHDIYWLLKPMVTAKVREKALVFDEVGSIFRPRIRKSLIYSLTMSMKSSLPTSF